MKPRFTLKFMLKATFACILLTFIGIGIRYFSPIRIDYFDVPEQIWRQLTEVCFVGSSLFSFTFL